jgi:phosphohistidine phosphatase
VTQKTLTLLRHAKAEAGASGQEDKARGLTERGVRGTEIIGKYLSEKGLQPDKVLCSSSIRTTETFLKVERAINRPLPVEYSDKLYLASAAEMLNLIATVPGTVQHLMVVAHNPGIHELCIKLAKEGDEQLIEKMTVKFPTCAVATFTCHAPDWGTLKVARCKLVDFVSPKMLGQEIA